MTISPRPPRLGRILLRLRGLGSRREEIDADLADLFRQRLATEGKSRATWWYFVDVLSLWMRRGPQDRPHRRSPRDFRSLDELRQDLVFATRLFRRQPGLFGATIAGLALAIGMSSAVFSIVSAMTARAYGVKDPTSLVRVAIVGDAISDGPWLRTDFDRMRTTMPSMSVTAASWYQGAVSRASESDADRDRLPWDWFTGVTGNYFQLLGSGASLGRPFVPADDMPGAPAVIVLSHVFWTSRLGADPAMVGKTVRVGTAIGDLAITVVGVAAPGFTGPTSFESPAPAGWMTFTAQSEAFAKGIAGETARTRDRIAALENRSDLAPPEREELRSLEAGVDAPRMPVNEYVRVYARLTPETTGASAEAALTTFARARADERGVTEARDRPTVRLLPLDDQQPRSVLGLSLPVLMTMVAVIVVLACANVANLLLAGAARRRREIGARLALGASRARIARQMLTESLLLASAGGVLGFVLGNWIRSGLQTLFRLPLLLDTSPGIGVMLFTTAVTVVTGLLAGLAPARFARHGDVIADLKSDPAGARTSGGRSSLRSWLIGGQAAGSIVLLALAALLTRSLIQIATHDYGLDFQHLMTFQGIGRGYDEARSRAFWLTAMDRVKQIEGVQSTALTNSQPFSSFGALRLIDQRSVLWLRGSPEYFSTLGIPILRGRTFSSDEMAAGRNVAVISQKLADRFWKDEEVIGSRLGRVFTAGRVKERGLPDFDEARIVGIVGETTTMIAATLYDAPTIYLPLPSPGDSLVNATLVVRTRPDPALLAGTVTAALRGLDPTVTHAVHLPRDSFKHQVEYPITVTMLASLVGATALGLAIAGLFGATAFMVGQRRHEVGIRMALGAERRAILSLLLRDGLRPVVIGLTVGLVIAIGAGRLIRALLFDVSEHDPIALVAAIVVLLGTAALAVLVPARQAASTDAARVLRQS